MFAPAPDTSIPPRRPGGKHRGGGARDTGLPGKGRAAIASSFPPPTSARLSTGCREKGEPPSLPHSPRRPWPGRRRPQVCHLPFAICHSPCPSRRSVAKTEATPPQLSTLNLPPESQLSPLRPDLRSPIFDLRALPSTSRPEFRISLSSFTASSSSPAQQTRILPVPLQHRTPHAPHRLITDPSRPSPANAVTPAEH